MRAKSGYVIAALAAALVGYLYGCGAIGWRSAAVLSVDMVEVSLERQQHVAVHEMAHAVAQSVLFGRTTVNLIHIHTKVCPSAGYISEHCCDIMDDSHHGGMHAASEGVFPPRGLRAARRRAAMVFAGPLADLHLNGLDVEAFSARDFKKARQHVHQGTWEVGVPADDYDVVMERELDFARAHAAAIVQANAFVIEDLAAHLLVLRPEGGKRVMTGGMFRRLLRDHRLVQPVSRGFPPPR